MTLLAAIDANGWAVIIGAIFLGIGQIVQMVLSWKRENRKIASEGVIAAKVDDQVTKLEEVHQATNGLTKALGEAKLAQGTAEGTAVGLKQGRDENRHIS